MGVQVHVALVDVVVKDVAGLMHLAFGLVHEISETALDLESRGLRRHGFYANLVADAGVSALAHVAAASATYSLGYLDRLDAAASLRSARECLIKLRDVLCAVRGRRYLDESVVAALVEKIDEAVAVTLALAIELKGAA